MAESKLFRLRVVFQKTGRLSMLSHLEVARALERAVRRAQLPFAVSQGYSPHMRIAFGAALPVGIGGLAEFFDLYLTSYVPPAKVLDALRATSVSDLAVKECYYVENNALAASVACPLSTYEVELSDDIARLVIPDTVTVVRKKKEKTLRVSDFLVGSVEQEGRKLRFTLEAKTNGSLRPDAFLRACLDETIASDCAPEQIHALTMVRVQQCAAEDDAIANV